MSVAERCPFIMLSNRVSDAQRAAVEDDKHGHWSKDCKLREEDQLHLRGVRDVVLIVRIFKLLLHLRRDRDVDTMANKSMPKVRECISEYKGPAPVCITQICFRLCDCHPLQGERA